MTRMQRMLTACTAIFRKQKDSGIVKTSDKDKVQSFTYKTYGTCSKSIYIEIIGDTVTNIKFEGGCPGSLSTIAMLMQGQKIDTIISKLSGIKCRNDTSCPDQLAKALIQIKNGTSLQ